MILKAAAYLLTALVSCERAPDLVALFTPQAPQLGRYEACTTTEPIAKVATAGMRIERVAPLEAFGTAGPYNRFALARLYGGTQVLVARGWSQRGAEFESQTLVSPYPDASLTRLIRGTLIIKHYVTRGL